MIETYNWIYADYRNNIWKFSLNDNKKLSYKIMYSEGKWTKENLIDIDILGFSIYIDENEEIHLVYSNTKGELKYCTMKGKEWVGKTIYKVESNKFEIRNIKIKMLLNEMNIFYLLVENDGSDHSILMHCIWKGKSIKFNTIQDIILIPNLKDYYSVHVNDNYEIDLFFITDEGDEVSLNHHNFENYIWSPRKRLYGIQGEDIGFETLINKDEFHILNKSKENEIYFLDYVFIDSTGAIKDARVCESKNKLDSAILFIEDNKFICCWIEEEKVFYSIYNGEAWGKPLPFDINNESELELVNIFCYSNEEYIEEKKVYINKGLDLYLLNPKDFFKKDKILIENIINDFESIQTIDENKLISNLKFEFSRVNSENKNLVNKINFLNKQIQNNQRIIKGYDEKISNILEKKSKIENKYDELLRKENKEKENIAKELLEEKNKNKIIEVKLKNIETEKVLIKEKVKSIERERYSLNEENNNIKIDIENINEENKTLNKENIKLNKKNEILNDLNLKLNRENINLNDKNKKINEENVSLNEKNRILNELNLKLNEEKNKFYKESQIVIEMKMKLNKENEKIIEINEKLIEEKMMLIEEKIALVKQNEKLNEELELERNQSVMDKLLRRRIN